MPFHDILVELAAGRRGDATRAFAFSMAEASRAHLTGVVPVGEFEAGYTFGEAGGLTAQLNAEILADAERLRQTFQGAATTRGVVAESLPMKLTTRTGNGPIAELARHFDLAVVGQPDPEESPSTPSILEAILFGAGRPILVVPYTQPPEFRVERVIVAWDRSREATLALAGSMPLLRRARHVEVTTIGLGGEVDFPGFNIARHLARHGVAAELRRITTDLDVGNALLSHAADVDADLLVMGAYGHSRLREMVLGGATRTILESMTLPVLMAH